MIVPDTSEEQEKNVDSSKNMENETESIKKGRKKRKNKKVNADMIVPDTLEEQEKNVDSSKNIGNETESVKKGWKKRKNKKVNADMITADPLEEVFIVDNSKNVGNEAESIKKGPKKGKHKLKNKGIMSYLQKNHITNDNIKMESVDVAVILTDHKEVIKQDEEAVVKEFTVCKVKGEIETSKSAGLESDCQSGLIESCAEISDDENVKSRKRKLRRSNSGTKKKLKLSNEEPVTRRRSLRNQPQISIELESTNPETCETSDTEKAAKFTAVKVDNDNISPDNITDNAVDDSISLEKEDVENLQDTSIEEKKETPNLRRSTRVRKKVIDDVPNDIEIEDDEEDVSFTEIPKSEGDLKIELDENSIVEISLESSDDDVQILKTTLMKAIVTLDLLEQSPKKSPRKPVQKVVLDEDYINSCLSWTEKYQPNKARYVIGDKSNTRQIYDWLTSWKERHESAIRNMVKSSNLPNQHRSDSESESEESDFEDYLCNTMMLSGPCGCGTTATVYACANQLDFKVLELNPSIYRTGKQIFDQVSEAVVSHQVNKVIDLNGVDKQPVDSAADVKKKFFSSKKDKCVTKTGVIETVKSTIESTVSSTSVDAMSLVLFEQVDIVYEDIDRGFYQGIADLRLLAKRPIILTANDPQILESMFAEEDSWIDHISLTYPNTERLLPMLHLMCLVEQVFVSKELLIDFINFCKNDVRKIILQLMFWCDQGKKPLFKIWKTKNKEVKIGKKCVDEDLDKSVSEINTTDAIEIIIDDATVPAHETEVLITEISPHILPAYKDESFLNKDQILNDGKCSCNIHGNYSFTKCSVKEQYSAIDHIAATANNISEMNSRLAIDQNYFEMDRYKWTSMLSDSLSDTFVKEKENTSMYPMVSMCKNVKKIYKENYDSFIDNKEKVIHSVHNRVNISYTDTYNSALHSNSVKYHINRKPFLEDVIPYMKKICQLEELKLSSLHQRKRGNRRYMHYLQSCGIHLEEGVLKELTKSLL